MFPCSLFMFWVYVMFYFLVSGCQYQCNWLHGKARLQNDLLCVQWDVKLYSLTLTQPVVSTEDTQRKNKRKNLLWITTGLKSGITDKSFTIIAIVTNACNYDVYCCWALQIDGIACSWFWWRQVDEFHSYVRPTANPRLTEFCKTLTDITQVVDVLCWCTKLCR